MNGRHHKLRMSRGIIIMTFIPCLDIPCFLASRRVCTHPASLSWAAPTLLHLGCSSTVNTHLAMCNTHCELLCVCLPPPCRLIPGMTKSGVQKRPEFLNEWFGLPTQD